MLKGNILMSRIFTPAALFLALSLPLAALAEARSHQIEGGQVSVPMGVTVQVKTVSVGEDATTVHLLMSLDTSQTGSTEMAFTENPTLQWGEGQMLHMRQVADNPNLELQNGQTLEGDLVFPGVIPPGVESVDLVFNPGNDGTAIAGPGVTIPLALK